MINYLLIFILFYLFFSYALTSMQILFAIALGIVFFVFIFEYSRKRITIHNEDVLFFSCTILNIIGIIKTNNKIEAMLFTTIILSLTLLRFILVNVGGWRRLFIKYSLVFSSIHILSTIIQYLKPNIVMKLNTYILSFQSYRVNYSQLIRGKYAGITGQIGTNAFFITIFIAIIFCWFMESEESKEKYTGVLLFIVGIITILLTGKRGLLLFNATTIILIIFIRNIKNKKYLFNIFLSIMIVALIIVGSIYLFQNINSVLSYTVDQDITSGRINIYQMVVELIKKSPYIGNGLYSVETIIGIKAHNIYLQLWAELGIVGLVVYLYTMIVVLYKSIKTYIGNVNNGFYNLVSVYIQIIFISYGILGNPLYDYFILGIYIIATALPKLIEEHRINNMNL